MTSLTSAASVAAAASNSHTPVYLPIFVTTDVPPDQSVDAYSSSHPRPYTFVYDHPEHPEIDPYAQSDSTVHRNSPGAIVHVHLPTDPDLDTNTSRFREVLTHADYQPTHVSSSGLHPSESHPSYSYSAGSPVHPHISTPSMEYFNIPVETYLGESEEEYVVFLRTIPSTIVTLRLEARALMISGSFPPLENLAERNCVLLHDLSTNFEKRIPFPVAIDPEGCTKKLNKKTATMVIHVKKFRQRHLGGDVF